VSIVSKRRKHSGYWLHLRMTIRESSSDSDSYEFDKIFSEEYDGRLDKKRFLRNS